MNAVSPALQAGESVVATVTVDGKVLDTDRIVSIETWNEANRLPRSRIVIYDGDPSSGKFPLSDSAVFAADAKVTIAAGYGSESAVLHSGVVIRHSLRIVPGEASQLVVETADPLIAMTLGRSDLVAASLSDHDLIAKLIGSHGGSVGKNEASGDPLEAVVQYQATDWDLLLLRSEANGCIVIVDDAKADVVAPTGDGPAAATIAYGDAIIAFEASVDATAEYAQSAVKSRSWNYATQALGEAGAKAVDVAHPGDFDPSTLAKAMGNLPLVQQTGAFLTDAQLAGWSTARLMRSRLAEVRGSVRVQGDAAIKPGGFVSLGGLGQRFDGKAFVSAVHHDIRDGGWTTSVDIGMAPDRFASRNPDIAYPSAAGLVPPIRGLHTGQVKHVATDPKGEFRVLVALPLTGLPDGVWARLGQIYASAGFGALFFPEVGDEVVLGFMDENPADPVVLGSLYSSKRAPADPPPNEANDTKAIVTRSQLSIGFDDKEKKLKISTPHCSILLDDKGSITITDPKNSVVMDSDGVKITSGSSLTLKSAQDMILDCGASLTLKGGAKIALSAPEVAAKASGTLSVASGGMGEIKAAAVLTVGGAVVKIN